MTIKVWSEREPGRWDECTEAAYLMALVFGGFTRFPLGAYTDAERDALEVASEGPVTSDTGSTFPVIDKGSLKRYGIRLRQIPDGTRAGLEAKLRTPGRALAMPGTYARLAAGHTLRRWLPSYTGGHAVCVVPLGGGKVLWLDPLATDNHSGDTTDVATALAFAWFPNDAREALAGEFSTLPDTSTEDDMIDPARHEPVASVILRGGTIYKDPDRSTGTWGTVAAGSRYRVFALPRVTVVDGKAALLPVLINLNGAGKPPDYQVGWPGVDQADMSTLQLLNAPAPVDCTAQVTAAKAETKAKAVAAVQSI